MIEETWCKLDKLIAAKDPDVHVLIDGKEATAFFYEELRKSRVADCGLMLACVVIGWGLHGLVDLLLKWM